MAKLYVNWKFVIPFVIASAILLGTLWYFDV